LKIANFWPARSAEPVPCGPKVLKRSDQEWANPNWPV
jgi:hypothetical protein